MAAFNNTLLCCLVNSLLSKCHFFNSETALKAYTNDSKAKYLGIINSRKAGNNSQIPCYWRDCTNSLLYQYHIHKLTISQFVLDVCKAIYSVLAPDYMKLLCLKEEWKNIIEQTNERWLFPNCFTAVDGGIICPKHPGSTFYNNKGFYSIVLLAFVD